MPKKYKPVRDPEPELEDIRDGSIAIFLNSGMTQQQVHEAGGPTPKTISKWLYKETRFPQLPSVRKLLKVCGGDLVVMSASNAEELRTHTPTSERLGTTAKEMPERPRKVRKVIPFRKKPKRR